MGQLLAHVEEEPLLQAQPLVLGSSPPHRSPPVPPPHSQAFQRVTLDSGSCLLASDPSQQVQPQVPRQAAMALGSSPPHRPPSVPPPHPLPQCAGPLEEGSQLLASV